MGRNFGGNIDRCFYDNQMSPLGGINNVDVPNSAEGRQTAAMLGNSLSLVLTGPTFFVFPDSLYPIVVFAPNGRDSLHPINFLAAAPVYLRNDERLDGVRTDFKVSNGWMFPSVTPPPPPFNPYTFRYQWGWHQPSFLPYSKNHFIYFVIYDDATIIYRDGWDRMSVRN